MLSFNFTCNHTTVLFDCITVLHNHFSYASSIMFLLISICSIMDYCIGLCVCHVSINITYLLTYLTPDIFTRSTSSRVILSANFFFRAEHKAARWLRLERVTSTTRRHRKPGNWPLWDKRGNYSLAHNFAKRWPIFKLFFYFLSKFVARSLLKIPPHCNYVSTLPREISGTLLTHGRQRPDVLRHRL